ncbi:hypothetical protein [Mesoterricola sediminis]|uniref:Uncharacterized protein n=1 Tax=Mesoterricola sediminis TaxID=2927980 RepID=A0AA48GXJ5_9BACT|nr:hypothetical protein [Mesoterricola sediminis]BDU76230.1 hypothetical protein METESE_11880 [Mesoterricola sediminis]
MVEKFCAVCRRTHESTVHCLVPENDRLRARVVELEGEIRLRCADLDDAEKLRNHYREALEAITREHAGEPQSAGRMNQIDNVALNP